MKKIFLILIIMLFIAITNTFGQITTAGAGNWSSTTPNAPWPSGLVPTSTDNVSIGHAVNVDDANAVCNNLVFTAGGSINFNSASSVLSVYGNATFGSGITNITAWTSGAKLVFAGTADQTLTTGTTTRFDAIEINKASGTVTQATGAIIRIGSSLTVTSGTFTLGSGTDIEGIQFTDGTTATTFTISVAVGGTLNISGATFIRSGSVNFTKIGAINIYGTANISTTSGNGLNFGAVTVGNGTDAASVNMTSGFGASGLFSFTSLAVNSNSTFTMNASTITASTFGTLSGTGTVVYGTTGTSTNLPTIDQNWSGNLTISCNRSVTLTANRSITGNVNITGTAIFQVGGAQLTVGGNLTVNEGAQIGCSNNSGTIVAAASGTQTFTLNGLCRVCSNSAQAPSPTTGFLRQFAFDSYVFGSNSIVSFRNPTTTASTTIVVNIDGPASTPFANVEFYDLQTVATSICQFLLRQNIMVTGSISFPRIVSGQPVTMTLNGYTLKVGNQILNSLGTLGSNTGSPYSPGGTRIFTMDGTIELNGSSAQNTLGGTDLPSTFNNLTLNNSTGVTIANAITLSGTLNLGGNNTYTNLNNITGYTGLTYSASVPQTTGSEFGSSITNLTINNSNGVTLGGSKTISGTLTLNSGLLKAADVILTLGPSATISGTPSATNMIVADYANCEIRKEFSANPGGSFTFPIGDNTNTAEYSPMTLTSLTAAGYSSAYVGVRVVNEKHPNNNSTTNYLTRYWVVTSSGLTTPTYSARFDYTDGDINGTEANIYGAKYSSSWTILDQATSASNYFTGTNLNSFSDFTGGENGALPVIISKFTASANKNNVTLIWSTATETQNAGWEIEKRVYKGEGYKVEGWKNVGFINGSHTSNAPKSYSFNDNNVFYGQYEYRLKQIDLDGTASYSEAIKVSVGAKPTEFALYENFPNPFNPSTKIRYAIPQAGKVTLNVYNSMGQIVATLSDEYTEAGIYEKEFDAKDFSSGIYVYTLTSNNVKIVKKMLLVK